MVLAGHHGDAAAARHGLADPEPVVRAAALGALARCGALTPADAARLLLDPSPAVRRRAATEAPATAGRGRRSALPAALRHALADPDPLVVEAACWALGELGDRPAVAALSALAAPEGGHHDPRCREAAVAALGAVGDPAGLAAVLGALDDKPAVRRRATVALAAFEGPEVEAGLWRGAADRDWQVRQVAEVLLGIAPDEGRHGGPDAPGEPGQS
jgi:HEAT repeat protein